MAGKETPKPQQDRVVIKPEVNTNIGRDNGATGQIRLPDLGNFEKAQNRWDFQDTSTPIKKSAFDSRQSAGNIGGSED